MRLALLVSSLFLLLSHQAFAKTIYIRSDGGTSTQCTGTTDAAYSSGSAQPCGFNHPNWAFPPRGESSTGASATNDTVVIHGPEAGTGVYRMGCQNASTCRDATVNLTVSANCDSTFPYDCWPNVIPNGVTVIGCTSTGCSGGTQPILWGAGKITHILDAANSSNVTIQDMELTDHEACGSANGSYGCITSASGLSAVDAILITGSTSLILRNLYIHGIARYAVYGGSNTNPLFDHINLDKNAYGGINFDSCGDSSCGESGTVTFNFTTITFSGCIENYTPTAGQKNLPGGITQCYDQNATGYGDAIGSNVTGGNFYLYNSDISHNTQDGLDLLYHNTSGTTLISRSRFEGNTGNQIKIGTVTNYIENSKIVGNCQYLSTAGVSLSGGFTTCRASGTPIAISPKLGQTTKISNTSVWGEDGTLMDNGCNACGSANTCDGSETMILKNNIFFGEQSVSGSGSKSSYFYCSGNNGDGGGSCCSGGTALVPATTYSTVWNTKDAPVSGTGNLNSNPKWNQGTDMSPEPTTNTFDMTLDVTSPTINAGNNTITFQNGSWDYNNYARSGTYTMGGYEYGTSSSLIPNTVFCVDAADCVSGICTANACTAGGGGGGSSSGLNMSLSGKFSISGKSSF